MEGLTEDFVAFTLADAQEIYDLLVNSNVPQDSDLMKRIRTELGNGDIYTIVPLERYVYDYLAEVYEEEVHDTVADIVKSFVDAESIESPER